MEMKGLILAAICGTFFLLGIGGITYAGHATKEPVPVVATCPDFLNRGAPNTIKFDVRNKSTTSQTVERIVIGYIGKNPRPGPLFISGPLDASVGPFTLAPAGTAGDRLSVDLQFPAVPRIFPPNAFIAPFGAVVTGGRILGSGACVTQVRSD